MSLINRIPGLLKWIFISMFLLLVLMFFYRLFFFYSYSLPGRPFTGSTFLLGLRYDARVVAAIGLGMLLLCLVPFLNPFKNKTAKKGWVIMLTIVFLVFLLVYVTDFYHYDYLQQRLNASVINFLPDAKISFGMAKDSYPLLSITAALAVLLALYAWLNNRLLTILIAASQHHPTKRKKWYYITSTLLLAVLIFVRLGQYPLRWSDAFSLGDDF
ncbi:MAG TPA: hypothetical protein VLR49_06960, partial [Ferruginibacter sp.]|nr:hypothetical protein [Ferruginibacter sp.]